MTGQRETPEQRIERYITRSEQLLEEAYAEPDQARREFLRTLASAYDDMSRTTGEYLKVA